MRVTTTITITSLVFASCILGSVTAWGKCYQKRLSANEVPGIDQASVFVLRWKGFDRVNNMAISETGFPNAKADFHCGSTTRCSLNGIGMYFTQKGNALQLKINGSFGLSQEGDSPEDDLDLFTDGKTDWILDAVPEAKCQAVFDVNDPPPPAAQKSSQTDPQSPSDGNHADEPRIIR